MTFEILVISILIILNSILAMAEFAITNARRNKIQQLADEGNLKANQILEYKKNPSQYLSTVQIGITVIGLLTGAFSGVFVARKLSALLNSIPFIGFYSDEISLIIVVVLLSYLSLLIELITKRLALHNSEKLALFSVTPTKILTQILKPLVQISNLSTDVILKIFGIKTKTEHQVTEDEIEEIIDLGTQEGTVSKEESEMMKRVFSLDEVSVSAIMTPVVDIEYLDINDDEIKNKKLLSETNHSYLPVCKGDLNEILGVVHVKDILSKVLSKEPLDFSSILKTQLSVAENTTVFNLLQNFKKTSVHIAIIFDEYGQVQGLVTLNDIMSAIVGNIPDEDDYEVSPPVKREDDSWLIDGKSSIIEIKDLFKIEELPDEDRGFYQTLAGFILYQSKKIPKEGEIFHWNNFSFEIVDMDGNRIDKILVKKKE